MLPSRSGVRPRRARSRRRQGVSRWQMKRSSGRHARTSRPPLSPCGRARTSLSCPRRDAGADRVQRRLRLPRCGVVARRGPRAASPATSTAATPTRPCTPSRRRCGSSRAPTAATSFSTGMAAVSNTLFALLAPGDRVVSVKDTYGGTNQLFVDFLPRDRRAGGALRHHATTSRSRRPSPRAAALSTSRRRPTRRSR